MGLRAADAVREYREYRRALRDELGIELPPGEDGDATLQELVVRLGWNRS